MFAIRLATVALLAVAALPAAAQPAITQAESEDFGARVRAYLLDNPEVLLEAFEVLEKRRQAAEADADVAKVAAHHEALVNDGVSPVLGNPDGDVTVVKFSDYRCGYCRSAMPILAELMKTDPGVRVVIKEFPILGEESVLAGRVALAASTLDPALYERLHTALFTHRGTLDEATILSLAEQAGASRAALRTAMDSPAVVNTIRATYELARSLGIEGTPSFVVGDRIVRGMVQLDTMKELVAEARRPRG